MWNSMKLNRMQQRAVNKTLVVFHLNDFSMLSYDKSTMGPHQIKRKYINIAFQVEPTNDLQDRPYEFRNISKLFQVLDPLSS